MAGMTSPIDSTRLRRVPQQQRSRDTLERVLDAADALLARDGADALVTTRVATEAGVSVGSLYAYFPDKEAIAEALALRHWQHFVDLVAAAAEVDERDALEDPVSTVLDALAAGFRAAPGFRALWFGELRTARLRDATRPMRAAVGASTVRILAVHFPDSSAAQRDVTARMLVLVGDGVLREAFRLAPDGDADVLAEARTMLRAYAETKLGAPA
jgi:AcrR family transcriptional regulator